jgi:aspartyl-tRNA(Asn)/glutamyl-tRNA(Gln) amidotransferase subunit C
MSGVEIDIHYVAQLARLDLTAEEEGKLREQLLHVLAYVEKLNGLPTDAVEPMSHAVPLRNVTRADEVRVSLAGSDALRNAPSTSEGLFVVPKIVE